VALTRIAIMNTSKPETPVVPLRKTVLIVEDNELNLKLFTDLLSAAGYATAAARDGREAIARARELKPDLVLMDIQLPELSGIEVTRWIKADCQLGKTPVLAMTAFGMLGEEGEIRAGGCDAYMTKPIVSARAFLATVRDLLGEQPDRSARPLSELAWPQPRSHLRAVR